MKKGNTISIIIMVIIVIVAALAFFTLQQSQVAPTKVYVWALDAHETKVITIEDVVEKTIPADAVTEDMIKVKDKVNKDSRARRARNTMPISFRAVRKNTTTQRTEKKSPVCSLGLSWSFPIRNLQERKNKRRT